MRGETKSQRIVAVLTANAAMSSILAMMLGECPALRVRQFSGPADLVAYARVFPIDILVCDYALPGASVPALVRELRGPRSLARKLKVVALTRHIDRDIERAVASGIVDEFVVKPMSPALIRERVLARLGLPAAPARHGQPSIATLRPKPRLVPAPAKDARPSAEIIDFLSRKRPGPPLNAPR